MIDGFVDGIKGAASKVTGAVSNVANKVTSYLHFQDQTLDLCENMRLDAR